MSMGKYQVCQCCPQEVCGHIRKCCGAMVSLGAEVEVLQQYQALSDTDL